ncbi:MAG: hypothetical protein H6561_15075 [Lewinellaceae bacterium]|nr:hypothetical protein [Lewinellaceae bacterium]
MMSISDEYMQEMVASMQAYTAVVLRKGPAYRIPDQYTVVWEHARRNLQLRDSGQLVLVFPINDGTETAGIGIFNVDVEQTRLLMDEDPAIKEKILTYEVHPPAVSPGMDYRQNLNTRISPGGNQLQLKNTSYEGKQINIQDGKYKCHPECPGYVPQFGFLYRSTWIYKC